MTIDEVRDELQRAYEGQAWHGAPLRDLLGGLSQSQVTARPVEGAHTLGELVAHIATWTNVVRRRFEGERVEVTPEEDWPGTEGVAWADLLDGLDRAHAALMHALDAVDDSVLEEPAPGRDYAKRVMLLGLVQHHAYHGGQIGLLRKLVSQV
jgi:uncharacterized damage-inducible protein DinB